MLLSQSDLQACIHTLLASLISPSGPKLSQSQHELDSIYREIVNSLENEFTQTAVYEMFNSQAMAEHAISFQKQGKVIPFKEFVAMLTDRIEPDEAEQALSYVFRELQNRVSQIRKLEADIFDRLPELFVKQQQTTIGDPMTALAAAYADVAVILLTFGDVLTAVRYLLESQLVFLKSGAVSEYRQVSTMLGNIEKQLDPLEFRDLVQRAFEPTRENGIVWGEYTILTPSEVAKLLHKVQEARKR